MNLKQIVQELNLNILTQTGDLAEIYPTGGYASDLLSCVLAGAKAGNVWVTLQAHINVVGVASMLDLCAVIITEGAMPEPPVLEKARTEGIVLLSTPLANFAVAGKLWELGLRG